MLARRLAVDSHGAPQSCSGCYQQQRKKGYRHHTTVRAAGLKWIRIVFR